MGFPLLGTYGYSITGGMKIDYSFHAGLSFAGEVQSIRKMCSGILAL